MEIKVRRLQKNIDEIECAEKKRKLILVYEVYEASNFIKNEL